MTHFVNTLSLARLAGLALALAVVVATGCNGDVCSGGDCQCTSGSCNFDCDGPGCDFQCAPGTSCASSCAEGQCDMQCTNAESCVLDCPGGGCDVSCVGTAECRLTGCTEGCQVSCGGAAICESSCTGPTCVTAP